MTDAYPMGGAPTQTEPITVNQTYSPNIMFPNVTYSTPCNCVIGCVISGFFLIGTFMFITIIALGISNEDTTLVLVSLFPLIFTIVSIILGIRHDLCSSITVDHNLQTVIIKTKKMCFCFSKSNIIQINEIKEVIARIDHSTHYNINGVYFNAFEIIFQLVDGRQVIGCSGVINKNNEGIRAASILRNAFPPNITFSGELNYQQFQYV